MEMAGARPGARAQKVVLKPAEGAQQVVRPGGLPRVQRITGELASGFGDAAGGIKSPEFMEQTHRSLHAAGIGLLEPPERLKVSDARGLER